MKKRIVICGLSRSGTSLLTHCWPMQCPTSGSWSTKSALNYQFDDETCLTKRPLDCFNLGKIFEIYSEDDVRILFL